MLVENLLPSPLTGNLKQQRPKDKTMVCTFTNIEGAVTLALVKDVPANKPYVFAQNGDPDKIFCHDCQSGRLFVNKQGVILLRRECGEKLSVQRGDMVVIICESNHAQERGYTKAQLWATAEDWFNCIWALKAQTVYRATACNHTIDGVKTGASETRLVCNKLFKLVNEYPRGGRNDTLGDSYTTVTGKKTCGYNTRWEELQADGRTWVPCEDPRPTAPQPEVEILQG